MRAALAISAVALLCAAPASAQVDSSAPAAEPVKLTEAEAAAFSKQIERRLAAGGARVAIVFRSGRPREALPDGISYTHGAFWTYGPIETEDGKTLNGYAVHNLYQGREDVLSSYLKQDFPYDFVKPAVEERVGVIVPTPGMQKRILEIMASDQYKAMHQPAYSLISNPHDASYQNCNEFMLDVIAASAWDTADRAQIKTNLAAYFEPSLVETSLIQRLFAPMADARLRTDDHDGDIRTTTFASMAAFMEEYDLSDASYEITFERDGAEN